MPQNKKKWNKISWKKEGYIIFKNSLIIRKNGKYTITGNHSNNNIIIKTNNVTLYFQDGIFNSNNYQPTILILFNVCNTKIYLNNIALLNGKNFPIIKLSKRTNLILKTKSSCLKGKIIFSGGYK